MKRSLSDITTGKQVNAPVSVLIYGKDGIGKSSFPPEKTIFQDVEGSTKELDVARLPEAETYVELLENIELLENEKHDFKSYAVDTLDWLEPMIWREVMRNNPCNGTSIEDYGYGKGYTYSVDVWRSFLARLELLQRRTGMNVVLTAHGAIRRPSEMEPVWFTLRNARHSAPRIATGYHSRWIFHGTRSGGTLVGIWLRRRNRLLQGFESHTRTMTRC
jgi:hypothetical protein